jgi:multicomponent Na+:H+ antiporter subunit E
VNLFVLNILLSLAWISLTGQLTPSNFGIGFGLGYLMLWLADRGTPSGIYFRKVPKIIRFILFFSGEVIKSNLRVAYEILTPGQKMKPGIVAVPLSVKTDLEITVFANLITLTPGTLSLDLSADRSVLYVHAMFIDDLDEFKQKLKQELETRLLEVMR